MLRRPAAAERRCRCPLANGVRYRCGRRCCGRCHPRAPRTWSPRALGCQDPHHQPRTALHTRRAIVHDLRGERIGGLGDVSLSYRDDVNGVKAHIELAAAPRPPASTRRRRLALMLPRRCVRRPVHRDRGEQMSLVVVYPDHVAAQAAQVIDRRRASRAQVAVI